MNLFWAVLIVIGVASVAVSVMLLVRRRAPEGSYFADGDRASGVFGVLATGFSVLLGFVVFLSFTSYDASRAGAETEALLVGQQLETADLFPEHVIDELTGELVCYSRSVVHQEWPEMEAGTLDEQINPWAGQLFGTVENVEPETASEQAAYSKWLDQTADREDARFDRIHGAVGVIPTPLWIVLFFISIVIFVYMLFFADRAERALTQGLLMGSVVSVIVGMLLLLWVLDNPFHSGVGGLRPVAMERTLLVLDEELGVIGRGQEVPCDVNGKPRAQ